MLIVCAGTVRVNDNIAFNECFIQHHTVSGALIMTPSVKMPQQEKQAGQSGRQALTAKE